MKIYIRVRSENFVEIIKESTLDSILTDLFTILVIIVVITLKGKYNGRTANI